MPADRRAPRGAQKAAILIVAIIAVIVVCVFVGFNLQHSKDLKTGHIDPAGQPKSATDLQAAPSRNQ